MAELNLKFNLRLNFAKCLICELFWQLPRYFRFQFAQSCSHLVFLLLLLLNLIESGDCALRNLVRVLEVILQFLVPKVVRLIFRTKYLLLCGDTSV